MYMTTINKKLENNLKISVRIRYSDMQDKLIIDEVGIIPKGKRKVIYLRDLLSDQYKYRSLSIEDRDKMTLKLYVHLLSIEILNQCLEEAWLLLKPPLISVNEYDIDVDVSNIYKL